MGIESSEGDCWKLHLKVYLCLEKFRMFSMPNVLRSFRGQGAVVFVSNLFF